MPSDYGVVLMDSSKAYESRAREFLQVRDKSGIGAGVVSRWASTLANNASVIELGCGAGYPITQVLHSAGLQIYAVDSSPTLVAEFQSRFPDVPVECAKVQQSNFFDRSHDAAIAIGLVFLLSETEQLALISTVARLLNPGGRFLFTAPIATGSWEDLNTGMTCRSLGRTAYSDCINASGLRCVDTYRDTGMNHYYDTQRVS